MPNIVSEVPERQITYFIKLDICIIVVEKGSKAGKSWRGKVIGGIASATYT